MSKRLEIDSRWSGLHQKLNKLFYENGEIEKELFDKTHGVIWLLHEKECIESGVLADYKVPEVDKMRSVEIMEMLAILKTVDVDALIEKLKKL